LEKKKLKKKNDNIIKQQKIISMHIGWALEKEKREKINNK
jgi:flagellin-specific chaperone FliS